jgi:hypothetical protein
MWRNILLIFTELGMHVFFENSSHKIYYRFITAVKCEEFRVSIHDFISFNIFISFIIL